MSFFLWECFSGVCTIRTHSMFCSSSKASLFSGRFSVSSTTSSRALLIFTIKGGEKGKKGGKGEKRGKEGKKGGKRGQEGKKETIGGDIVPVWLCELDLVLAGLLDNGLHIPALEGGCAIEQRVEQDPNAEDVDLLVVPLGGEYFRRHVPFFETKGLLGKISYLIQNPGVPQRVLKQTLFLVSTSASPKSATFTVSFLMLLLLSRMFSSFKSRCTIRFDFIMLSPVTIYPKICCAIPSERCLYSFSSEYKSPPSSNSVIIITRSSSSNTSSNCRIFRHPFSACRIASSFLMLFFICSVIFSLKNTFAANILSF